MSNHDSDSSSLSHWSSNREEELVDEEILNSQEDTKEAKRIFNEILDQIKAYSEAKRIDQVKSCFEKVIPTNELIARSVNASLGNNLEV